MSPAKFKATTIFITALAVWFGLQGCAAPKSFLGIFSRNDSTSAINDADDLAAYRKPVPLDGEFTADVSYTEPVNWRRLRSSGASGGSSHPASCRT